MLSYEILLHMTLGFALVLVVPGPTNTLLLSSGIAVGFTRAAPLVLAEALGYLIAISSWGFFLLTISRGFPPLAVAIKILCAIYIAVLGVKLWRSNHAIKAETNCRISFGAMLLATMLNPKAILFASSIFPLQAFSAFDSYLITVTCFVAILVPVALSWVGLGAILRGRHKDIVQPRLILRCAATLLFFFSGALVYSAMLW